MNHNTTTSHLENTPSFSPYKAALAGQSAPGHAHAGEDISVLAKIRHDLRTPLNAIIGYCELLQEDHGSRATTYFGRGLHTIRESAQTLQNLIDDLPVESAGEMSAADLHEIGRHFHAQAGDALRAVLQISFVLLQSSCRSSDPSLQTAVPELGKIRAAAQKFSDLEHDFANLTPAEHVDVAEFVSPSQQEPADASGAAPADAMVKVAHLLVADDNEENRELLKRRLQRQGYTVVTACNGREALDLMREQAFDLILLDIMMPKMDGMEVLSYLKSQSTLRHVPVIVISALDDIDSVARCIEMGAEDYLPKPFNPVLLRARVHAGLEKKRLRDREIQLYEQLQENYHRLQEVEELRDSLIHMVVHDMRTPLTSVLTGLSTLEAAGSLNEIQQECLRIGQGSGHSLMMMINDLLDINQMEENALELQCEELVVQEVVNGALDKVQTLASRNKQTVSAAVAPDLPPIKADRIKLERILVNLLGNAIKFTGSGGIITLSARRNDETADAAPGEAGADEVKKNAVLFAVADTGDGIPPDALEKIFDKFGQVRTDRTRRTFSTGLGLTFCKLAVEAHQGRIWVESELGQGSTFYFTIPL